MTLLAWQQVGHLLKLSIALLNVTLVANCAARSFPGLRDDLLRFLGLVGDVRLGWLLLVVFEELRIVVH